MSEIDHNPPAAGRHGIGALAIAAASLALVLALIALGWLWQIERRNARHAAERSDLGAEIALLDRRLGQTEAALRNTEQRQQDAATINRNLRDEMLGVAERAQLLETTVQQLNQRGIDNVGELRLNNAAFLLSAGVTRLHVFHDHEAALMALRLADAELAAMHDPVVAGVRQTLANEIAELAALPAEQERLTLDLLQRLHRSVEQLPLRTHPIAGSAAGNKGWAQRFGSALGDFVRVRQSMPDAPRSLRPFEAELAKAELRLALLQAEAAWLRRDAGVFKQQTDAASRALKRYFAADSSAVQAAANDLAALQASPLLSPTSTAGSALEQLRNLLASKRLSRAADLPE